ncbi:MAG: hypothetical protein JO010_07450 [Alphaproteobacteria bacterium]|nr:hypothetical protein [Alphaproteobacteria bacterium]
MTIWHELGLDPTADRKAIRGAYARRLRTLDPDRDPAAFQRLRAALEAALEWGEADVAAVARPLPPEQPSAVAPAAPRPQASPEEDARRIALAALVEALDRGDTDRAFAALDRLMTDALLPAGEGDRFVAALMALAVDDRNLSGTAFRAIASRFGWDSPICATDHPDLHKRVSERLVAEDWYEALLVDAAARKRARRAAVKMFLGRLPRWQAVLTVNFNDIAKDLAVFEFHSLWLEGRIDAAHIAWMKRALRPLSKERFLQVAYGLLLVGVTMILPLFLLTVLL